MAWKYGQVEKIAVHQQNTLTYYVKYVKEEDRVKALLELIDEERLARVVVTVERNVNVSKSVMIEHYFKDYEKQEKN